MATTQFTYTGGVQSWTSSAAQDIKLRIWGAGGGKGGDADGIGGSGGNGGYLEVEVAVSNGETLDIYVGGGGSGGGNSSGSGGTGGAGGWGYKNGGDGATGDQGGGGGGGGGGSAVLDGANAVIASSGAGGGGGGYEYAGSWGGGGGGGARGGAGGSGFGTAGSGGGVGAGGDGGDGNSQGNASNTMPGGAGGTVINQGTTLSSNAGGGNAGNGLVEIETSAAPAAPIGTDATYRADDQVDLYWEPDTTGGPIDHFEIQVSRDGAAFADPAAGSGPASVTHDGSASYTKAYSPDSDQPYGSVVGIDSSFQFRVRAVGSGGASAWSTSDTVATAPRTPHNVSISRPDASTFKLTGTNQSDLQTHWTVHAREDTGGGYGAWFHYDWIDGGEAHVTGSPNTKGSTITATYSVGTAYAGNTALQTDARYQFRVRAGENQYQSPNMASDWVYADYGNQGNVFFTDGFESNGLTNWTTTSLADADSGVTSGTGPGGTAVSGADEGTYYLRLDAADSVTKNLGDLSAETDVMVKAAVAVGSSDAATEAEAIEWYDGAAWTTLQSFAWEYNRQGWVDVSAVVPNTALATDNRVRFSGVEAGGVDHFLVDRVVVSDLLHEYTMPAAPTNLATDDTVEDQLTITWTHNATFTDRYEPFYRATGATSWTTDTNEAATATSHTFTGLADGERYDLKTREVVEQHRHGAINSWWFHENVHPDGTTILPVPTLLSSPAHADASIDLSWADNADNEDGHRVLLSRDSQSFEGGFGAWTSGAWTLSTTQAYAGTDSAYSDGLGGVSMTAADITVPTGQMAVDEQFYLPVAPGTGNLHLVAYEGPNSWAGPHLSLQSGTLQHHAGGAWHDSGYAPPTAEWVRLATYIDVANQWFSVMVVDSTGVHQPIKQASFIGRTDSFIAGDVRHLKHGPGEEAYLDAVTEYTETNTSPLANATTATASGLLNGERYHVALAAYTEHTGVLDN